MADDAGHSHLLTLEAATLKDVGQYGRCSLADKARVQKLSLAIQDKLSRIRALTRDLELEVEELDSDEERQAAAALLAQHKGEYERIQSAFKQAALAQRTTALRSAADERRELLAGGEGAMRQRKLQAQADSVALAEDVTGGLRRTRQVLAEELEHTSATLAAMEASHAGLGKTRDEYHGQHRQLKRSKGLLGALNWQAKSEAYLLWFGLTIFLAVCAYVFQKRAGHFVPARLKPSALLSATGLPAYLRGDGRPAVRQPQGLRRPQAQPPLRKARGSGMQDPGGAPVQQMPEATQQESAGVPPTPPSVPPPQLQVSPEAADEQAVWPSAGPPAAQEVPAAAAEEVPAVPATQEAPAVSAHEMPAATEQEQHVLPVATEQQQPTEEAGMEHAAVAKQQEPAAAAVEQQQQQEPAAAAAVQEHQAGEGVAAPVDAAVGPEGAPQLPPDSTAPTVMQEQQPVAAEAAEGRPVEGAPPPPPPQQQGSSTIIHDPRGRPIAVDSAKDFVQQPPPAQAQAAEEEAVAAGQAGAAEAPPVDAAREEL